jgi:hypothetical protein
MTFVIAGALGFVALGLWMAGLFGDVPESRRWPKQMVQLLGWISVIFFGSCAAVGLRRAFDTDVQLRISRQGIYWKPWSEATIPWHEIHDIRVWEFRKQRSIILSLHHPELYPSKSILGRLAAANRSLTGGDISISMTGLNKSFDEALAAAHEYGEAQ